MEYRRRFDPSGEDSLAKLARWIRPGTTVLELGSAAGYFTAYLASLAAAVDIVEIDANAAAQAAAYARKAVVGDLEGDAWLESLGDTRYDTIVCADVLEHVHDGAKLLRRLRDRLAPGGELLLSVPNVAHNALIACLVDDRFDYGGEGLLDPTHVRLYTWRSLARLLHETGLRIGEWDATTLSAFDTEFRVRTEALPPPLRELFERRPRGRVYQWLVRAGLQQECDLDEAPAIDVRESVPVRLLAAESAEALSLDHAQVARVPIGAAATDVDWPLESTANVVRIMLADRIGVVRVDDVALRRGGETLWSLARGDRYRSQSVVPVDASTFVLTAPDAWIEPELAGEAFANADRAVATIAWPSGIAQSDAFAALAALARAREASEARADECRHRMLQAEETALRYRNEVNAARTALENVQATLSRRNAYVDSLEQSMEAFRAENARLGAAVTAQERIITYRQSLRWWLRLPFVRVKLWWHRLTSA